MNSLKTVGLLGFMSALAALIAMQFSDGFVIPLVFVVGLNFVAYFFSDKMAIAATRAKPVAEHELPQVYGMETRLVQFAYRTATQPGVACRSGIRKLGHTPWKLKNCASLARGH